MKYNWCQYKYPILTFYICTADALFVQYYKIDSSRQHKSKKFQLFKCKMYSIFDTWYVSHMNKFFSKFFVITSDCIWGPVSLGSNVWVHIYWSNMTNRGSAIREDLQRQISPEETRLLELIQSFMI